jgi:four helix bundle protein
VQDFHNLKVWQKAHQVALGVYGATRSFPNCELYGITGQLRRAAASIPANLAEGCGRQSDREFSRSAHFAMGSASELEYFLLLARDLEYLAEGQYEALNGAVVEVKRMLAALIERLSGKGIRLTDQAAERRSG